MGLLFEELPIEIFQEVFSFLTLKEIIKGFYRLNSYIDLIIRSINYASHTIKYKESVYIKFPYAYELLINRLIIIHADGVNLKLFTNLRSLTLKYGTEDQFNSIRPQYLPQLEILHIYASKL